MAKTDLTLDIVIGELDRMVNADHAAASALRQAAGNLAERLRQQRENFARHTYQPQGRKTYDDWLSDLFFQVENARPREELLRVFAERFSEVWITPTVEEKKKATGPWLLLLEANTDEGGVTRYQGLRQTGLNDKDWSGFRADSLHNSKDPLLERVLVNHQPVEMWYLGFLNADTYGGVFDTLVPGGRRRHIWVQALPLVDRNESRAVFLLYHSRGDALAPHPPGNATYDWRMLRFLSIAYRHLDRQIKNLAVYVEESRRDMINLLAPGLLHHEVGFVASGIANMSERLERALARINTEYDLPQLADQVARSRDIAAYGLRLRRVTHAFNRLDRRGVAEEARLAVPVEECRTLLAYRLDKVKVGFFIEEAVLNAGMVKTDITLVTHALLNICNNALNAIEEEADRLDGQARAIHIRLARGLPDGLVGLDISNDGPPIPPEILPRIFERGYTTRREGHGQGLYLVQLIAQYLGGEAHLLTSDERPNGCSVGFVFTLLQQHDIQREIGHDYIAP